jgi:hypothetical protein
MPSEIQASSNLLASFIRYAVTNERARDILLNRLHDLKLDHCESVTDYTNQVRQIKADLKTVKYDMTDDVLLFEAAIARGKAMKKSGCEHVVSHIIFDCLEIRLD